MELLYLYLCERRNSNQGTGFKIFMYVTRDPTARTVTSRLLLSFQYNRIDCLPQYYCDMELTAEVLWL